MVLNAGGGREDGTGAYAKPRGYGLPNFGTVYGVVGSSSTLGTGTWNHPAMFFSTNLLGSMVLEINGDRLDARFIRETGAVIDWFTLLKTNTPPVAHAQNLAVSGNTNNPVLLTATDLNRDPVTFSLLTPPTNGFVTGFNPANGSLTYTSTLAQAGSDTFSFTASDGQATSDPASVLIAVYVPGDTNSPPAPEVSITPGAPGTGPTLSWQAVGGVRYRIHYSDGDAQGGYNGVFIPLERSAAAETAPGTPGLPVLMDFTDDFTLTPPPAGGTRYYRIEILP